MCHSLTQCEQGGVGGGGGKGGGVGSPYPKIKNVDKFTSFCVHGIWPSIPRFVVRILQTQSRQKELIKTNMKIILPPFSVRCMTTSFTVHILKNTQYSERTCSHLLGTK